MLEKIDADSRLLHRMVRGLLPVACLAVLVGALGCPDRVVVAPRPNLLLISIDTLRADHVGAYGPRSAETTALDELARRGVVFENAMAAAPLTLPSHASLLTGQHPPHHGVRHNGLYRLPESTPTLARSLQTAGYNTAAIVGAIVLARETGIGQGFDHFDDGGSRKASEVGGFLERSASEVSDAAVAALADLPEPWALWIHYYDPHQTWQPPSPWAERFESDLYAGEIAYTDSQVARVLETIERNGQLDRTVVAVTSDHGEGLGEHGEQSHSYTLYDATLRVPLILAGPSLPAGTRVEHVVGLVDVAPTLLEILGQDALDDADGNSLKPLWSGGRPVSPGAYSESLATQINHGWAPAYSWRTDTHRFIDAPRPELYELASDPAERRNLLNPESDPDPYTTKQHRDALAAVLSGETEGERRDLDEQSRQQLVALGYALPESEVRATAIDPKDGLAAMAQYALATQHLGHGEHAKARPILESILKQMPDSALSHTHLARVLAALGELDKAVQHAARATALVPGSGEFLSTLAMIELQLGRLDAAATHFVAAEAHDPSLPQCQAGAMWAAVRRGELEIAIGHEERALELDPGGWRTRQWLATLWSQLGRPVRAIELLESALALSPDEPDLHSDIAINLVRVGRSADAARHLARLPAVESSPAFGNRIAIAYAQSGETDQAIELFERILKRHPRFAPAERNLASLRSSLANP